ncbi:PREDICTED: uncharacterized protein LOC108360124 isoform X1 [Rhagoletis zephyria]|uniref:uncharacterized protein LOC108360124 isoform X1 n=1 Tax=Rhagoletis zephyria TaxID=28612 RepID=UPI0008117411|nr:PREDICTED: uncharacterized protein LOC108360124 isoform X1 [Rhagoletis zephyria]
MDCCASMSSICLDVANLSESSEEQQHQRRSLIMRPTPKFDLALSCKATTFLLMVLFSIGWLGYARAERDFNFNDSQVPLLEPRDEPAHTHYSHDPYSVEVSSCRAANSEIVLSLVLKSRDWTDLSDNKKDKVLEKLSKFFAIPKEFIVMESVTKRELSEMQKESIRRGHNKCHNNYNRPLGRVSFVLGCGSTYFTMSEPINKQIGAQMKDGSIDNITGEKFGWWVIWRKQYKTRAQRNRRQTEGSGTDDAGDDYDYVYDDDDEDVVENVTELPAVTTHAHRHHHGVGQSNLGDNNSGISSVLASSESSGQITQPDNAIEEKVPAVAPVSSSHQAKQQSPSTGESNFLVPNKESNIDEEIVESVSQLESVITKTIENTKNIKELPVIEEEGGGEDVPVAVEIEKELGIPNTLEELNTQLAQSNDLDTNVNLKKNQPVTSTSSGHELTTSDSTQLPSQFRIENNIENEFYSFGAAANVSVEANAKGRSGASIVQNKNGRLGTGFTNKSMPPLILNELEVAASTPPSIVELDTSSSAAITLEPFMLSTTIANPMNAGMANIETVSLLPLSVNESQKTAATTLSPLSSVNAAVAATSLSASTYFTASTPSALSSSSFSVSPSTVSSTASSFTSSFAPPSISSTTTASLTTTTPSITTPPLLTKQQQVLQQTQRHQTVNQSTNSFEKFAFAPSTPISGEYSEDRQKSVSESGQNVSAMLTTQRLPSSDTTTAQSMRSESDANESGAYTEAGKPFESPTTTSTFMTTSVSRHIKKDDNETSTLLPAQDSSRTSHSTIDQYSSSPTTTISSSTTSTYSTTPTTVSEAISPSAGSGDYVEAKVENTPPMIRTRLQKFAVTSGKAFSYSVPQDTFFDTEDLTNLRLDLTDKDGRELKASSWLQFNPETHVLYGLPLDDSVSKWQYRLSATDSGNESVTETLEISVQQHRGVRTVNHEISITVKINEKNMHNIDWQLKLMRDVASTLGDENTNWIVVREIRPMPQDPNTATFVYFNETFPTSECPEAELNKLVKRLDASRLSDLVYPTLSVKSITGQLIGSCQKTHLTKPKPTTHISTNVPPLPRNQVDRVNATVGHLLVFKVPSDTFYDPNDNEQLTLTLKTKDHKELNPRHWLQFDSKNQEFYGIPKSGDAGSEEYLLVAQDAGGLTATDALVVVVNHAPKKEFSVYFKAYLAIRHEQFNADLQRKFVERVAHLFGDSNTQYVQIRSVTTHHDSDSTIVNFYNTSLYKSHNRCPEEEIEAVRSVYLVKDHMVRDHVKKVLGPELNLTNVQPLPLGLCHPQTDIIHRDYVPTKTDQPTLKSSFSDEYLYTIILPAVIIISMIIIALLIACCLHRRRRKSGKMELGDEEERRSFRKKNIPVIFQDELDEKPEIGNKSPIILKDEKPPLLPPSYNTSNMNGENDVDEYVPPPAVVVGGREARGKSPATPSYRKPPPYVSP